MSNTVENNMEELCDNLLKAIKPSLRAPISAVLCSPEELSITNNNGEYSIEGYVNSQNGYGAMIKTDFTAKATQSNGTWVIGNTRVGFKTAKENGKQFAMNYVAISIFVAIMGALGYFVLTMLVG